jgi:hypothetical protein
MPYCKIKLLNAKMNVSRFTYGREKDGLYKLKQIKFKLLKTIKEGVFMLYIIDTHHAKRIEMGITREICQRGDSSDKQK